MARMVDSGLSHELEGLARLVDFRCSPEESKKIVAADELKDLPRVVLEVIDCAEFRRLGGVLQNGIRGVHTRRNHCIDVALSANKAWHRGVGYSREAFVLAALLHDIGHGMFSHTTEAAFPEMYTKEHYCKILEQIFANLRIQERFGVSVREVALLAFNKDVNNPLATSHSLSLDHERNALKDLKMLSGVIVSVPNTEICKDTNRPTYGESQLHYAQALLEAIVYQNEKLIFAPDTMLMDRIMIVLMRGLVENGALAKRDLLGTDAAFYRALMAPEATAYQRKLFQLALSMRKMASAEREMFAAAFVRKVADGEGDHKVNYIYASGPMIGRHHAIAYFPEFEERFAELRQRLIGAYDIDVNGALAAAINTGVVRVRELRN